MGIPPIVNAFLLFLSALQLESVHVTKQNQHINRNFWKTLDEKIGWELILIQKGQVVPTPQIGLKMMIVQGIIEFHPWKPC